MVIASGVNMPNYYGYYNWIIPLSLVMGTDYLIRVTDHANSSVYEFSDYFTINATKNINVFEPGPGYNCWANSNLSIYWQRTGSVISVDIELYKGTSPMMSIVNNSFMPGNSGRYNWSVPVDLATGTDYRIYVADHTNASIFGFSVYFIINSTKIITVSGPLYLVFEKDNVKIMWVFTGYIPRVDISLMRNETPYIDIVLNLANPRPTIYPYSSYTWKVPESMSTTSTYQFRVRDSSNALMYGLSPTFTINNSKLIIVNVMSPVRVYELASIQWFAYGGITAVNVDLYNAGLYQFRIWSNLSMPLYPVDQRYWFVPGNLYSGNNYTIKVSEFGNASIYGISNPFTINATKTIRVLSPTNISVWNVDHAYSIMWETTGAILSVNLDLYRDGAKITTIGFNATNTGQYSWKVPGSITESNVTYRVLVSDYNNASLYAFSQFFTINATKAFTDLPDFDLVQFLIDNWYLLVIGVGAVVVVVGVTAARWKKITKVKAKIPPSHRIGLFKLL